MPANANTPSPRGPAAPRAAVVARSRSIGPRQTPAAKGGGRNAGAREEERARLAKEIHAQIDSLLIGLRMDLAWLDRCLAEQAGSNGEAVRTMRMQMRIRCDTMDDQLEQVAASLERIVGGLRTGQQQQEQGTPP